MNLHIWGNNIRVYETKIERCSFLISEHNRRDVHQSDQGADSESNRHEGWILAESVRPYTSPEEQNSRPETLPCEVIEAGWERSDLEHVLKVVACMRLRKEIKNKVIDLNFNIFMLPWLYLILLFWNNASYRCRYKVVNRYFTIHHISRLDFFVGKLFIPQDGAYCVMFVFHSQIYYSKFKFFFA